MTEKLAAAPEGLVVAVEGEGAGVRSALARVGDVADLESAGLVLVRPNSPQPAARAAWSDLLSRVPEAAWAAPVMKDADGNELYPTGSLVVRFRKRPAERALRTFAGHHGLVVESRNEFVPEQATFRPLRPRETYLPDLVEKLARLPEVTTAWVSTLARYRRV
jgi:hypothetical protein